MAFDVLFTVGNVNPYQDPQFLALFNKFWNAAHDDDLRIIMAYFDEIDANKDQKISVEEAATPAKKSCREDWPSKDADYKDLASKFVAKFDNDGDGSFSIQGIKKINLIPYY